MTKKRFIVFILACLLIKVNNLSDRLEELETRIEHHSDMIYNKLQKKEEK